jgi:Sulfotransferase family
MTTTASGGTLGPLRLHFLVFAPRSGSTLFAKTLSDAYPSTLVLPEFRTAEFLLARSEQRVRSLTIRSLQRIFGADRQLLPNLGISPETAQALAEENAGAGTLEILSAIVARYTENAQTARNVVVKLGSAAEFLPRLREVSPQGTVVHVYRDGRATVNSLLSTPRAYFRNETMGRGDVAHCCGLWLRHQRTMRRAEGGEYPIVTVRYESFVEDPQETCREAAGAMRLEETHNTRVRSFAVSAREAGLHRLVATLPSRGRRAAWRSELPREDQIFADWRMRRELSALGYDDRVAPSAGPGELMRCIAMGYARHVKRLSGYTVRRAAAYARRPGAVFEHANARAAGFLSRRRHLS